MVDELETPVFVKKWFIAVLALSALSIIPSLGTLNTVSVVLSVVLVVWAYRWVIHHLPHHVGSGRSFSRVAVGFLIAAFVASLYTVIIPVLYFPLLYLGHGINSLYSGGVCGGVLGQCELLLGTVFFSLFLLIGMWIPVRALLSRFENDLGVQYSLWIPLSYTVVLFLSLVFLPYALVGVFSLI